MSPEVIRHGKYSAKADVFSFAVVINELFTCQRPYERYDPAQAALCVVRNGLRPSLKRIRSKRLNTLIQSCWDADPRCRPDWDHIITELEKAQAQYITEKLNSIPDDARVAEANSSAPSKSV